MVAASKECWRKWGLEQPLWRKNWQYTRGFPGGLEGKEYACSAGNLGLIPELGRSPGEGHGHSLQHSSLENPMDRDGVTELDTTEQLSKVQGSFPIAH